MLKVGFICDVVNADGDVVDEGFVFDQQTFKDDAELQAYCDAEGYEVNESCGSWGLSTGIFTGMIIDD